MPLHRFKVGSSVLLTADGSSALASRYIVEAQMPPVGSLLQYRIKNEAENFRRVVVEHQLKSSSPASVAALAQAPEPAVLVDSGEEN